MTFHSILFEKPESNTETTKEPDFFRDLNLDQVVEAITAGKREYHLKPFFYAPLNDIDAIRYRHEIMQELENDALLESIERFAQKMHFVRDHLAQADRLYYRYQKHSWFLDAVDLYCDAVTTLAYDMAFVDLRSRGFLAFRDYVTRYVESGGFSSLQAETKKLKADLSSVKYCLLIKNNSIQVRKYDSEIDCSADVAETFEKFRQGAVADYSVAFPGEPDMNHVEAGILDRVAQLYPDTFQNLNHYCANNGGYLDETIGIFDREIQFYVAYLQFIKGLKRAGLKFCYPGISRKDKEVYNYEGFDLALAHKLSIRNGRVVCNDFCLTEEERVFVVSGPNQGGKTTFARAFGQIHYFASLGCPVPGREAQLFLFDKLFTHFEKEENIQNLQGKLQDDLVRIHHLLERATPNSLVIINEIFASTTLQDSIFLGKKMMEKIAQLDLLCVCVTFIVELSSLNEKTVSLVSTIVPENPALRTYQIVRAPADGLAHALSIAKKYQLTYACIKERLKS